MLVKPSSGPPRTVTTRRPDLHHRGSGRCRRGPCRRFAAGPRSG
ncbi:hypothetical protein Ae505Ps2_6186 [Pseudonocardia sp. Ae505_Ps2]|nr:hypothetical protein Ae505Ps2_6176 [Pseudonocardia sp. Ae505_Ps2]OLM08373.1 hypothetical protein Ae505Ps2_6180 [Pseudonocardia sp. Ae505_Ps2]OLM08376.1 hypothetical protein Ae505Ps2_6183 [Pseudonocardia sp. Ae505_Ps2]OLM08379.1 hypothetical protein Ae505Ps2_6186 [Pseudonocardia sp. Ae505_Ps2]